MIIIVWFDISLHGCWNHSGPESLMPHHTIHYAVVPQLSVPHGAVFFLILSPCLAGYAQLSQGDLTHHLPCLGQVLRAFWSFCISKVRTKQQTSININKHHTSIINIILWRSLKNTWFWYLVLILCFRLNKIQRSTQLKQQGQLAKACEIQEKPVAKRIQLLFKIF